MSDESEKTHVIESGSMSVTAVLPPPKVTLTIYFSRYQLHAARMFRDQVRQLEGDDRTGSSLEHRSLAIACIISSTTFLEAVMAEATECASSAANHPGQRAGFGAYAQRMAPASAARVRDILPTVEKALPFLDKAAVFLALCDLEADRGKEPWQSTQKLFELRNALVHPRPIDTGRDGGVHEKIQKSLGSLFGAGRRPLHRMFSKTASSPFFPDQVLGTGCCDWAVATAEAFACNFAERCMLGPDRWWDIEALQRVAGR